jgi:hypothetical protein
MSMLAGTPITGAQLMYMTFSPPLYRPAACTVAADGGAQ